MKINKSFFNIVYKLSIKSLIVEKKRTLAEIFALQISTNIILLVGYLCRRDNADSKEQLMYYRQDVRVYCIMLLLLSVFFIWIASIFAEKNNIRNFKIIEHFTIKRRILVLIRIINKICMALISIVLNFAVYYFMQSALYKNIVLVQKDIFCYIFIEYMIYIMVGIVRFYYEINKSKIMEKIKELFNINYEKPYENNTILMCNKKYSLVRLSVRNILYNKTRSIATCCITAIIIAIQMCNIADFTTYTSKCNYIDTNIDGVINNYSGFKDNEISRIADSLKEFTEVNSVIIPDTIHEQKGSSICIKIKKEKCTDYLKEKIYMANRTFMVDREKGYYTAGIGIVGCNNEELSYLKEKYYYEGNFELKDNEVLIPMYFKELFGLKTKLTRYKIGDKIVLSRVNDDNINEDIIGEYKVAGFVNFNPFEATNGTSSGFTIIMNNNALSQLGKLHKERVYLDIKDGEVNKKTVYKIENTIKYHIEFFKLQNDDIIKSYIEDSLIGYIINFIFFFICVVVIVNYIIINCNSRYKEFRVLYESGWNRMRIIRFAMEEYLLIYTFSVIIANIVYIYIINTMNFGLLLTEYIFYPMRILIIIILVICVLTYTTLCKSICFDKLEE